MTLKTPGNVLVCSETKLAFYVLYWNVNHISHSVTYLMGAECKEESSMWIDHLRCHPGSGWLPLVFFIQISLSFPSNPLIAQDTKREASLAMQWGKNGQGFPEVQVHGFPSTPGQHSAIYVALASDAEIHTLQCLEFSCLFNAYSQRVLIMSSRWLRLRKLKALLYLWPLQQS